MTNTATQLTQQAKDLLPDAASTLRSLSQNSDTVWLVENINTWCQALDGTDVDPEGALGRHADTLNQGREMMEEALSGIIGQMARTAKKEDLF